MSKKNAVNETTTEDITNKMMDNLDAANTPKCSTFGGAKQNHKACLACSSKFKERNKACIDLTAKAIDKKKVKKLSTAIDCFDARVESDTHKFINHVYSNPFVTMKEIKALSWNKRPNTFYDKANLLINKGYMLKNKKKEYSLSAKGKALFEKWIAEQKKLESEIKKAA